MHEHDDSPISITAAHKRASFSSAPGIPLPISPSNSLTFSYAFEARNKDINAKLSNKLLIPLSVRREKSHPGASAR